MPRRLVIALAAIALATIFVALLPLLASIASIDAISIRVLELVPKGNSSTILMIGVSNPTILDASIKVRAIIYVNGTAVASIARDVRVAPGHEELVKVLLPMGIRGSRAFVELKGEEVIETKLLFLPNPIPLRKGLDVGSMIRVSPCYIKVVATGFRPSVAVVGQKVVGWATLYSSDRCSAVVELKVFEDVAFGAGIAVASKSYVVKFPGTYVLNLSWSPPYPSSSSLRGYYIAVYVNGTKIYEMPPLYPPRLRVYLTPPKTATSTEIGIPIRVVEAWWSANGERITVAKVGEEVSGCVEIASSKPWSGPVTIKIVEDSPTSSVVAMNTFEVSISPTKPSTICIAFTPRAPSTTIMRGYYIVVESRGATLYVMPPSYPPRLTVRS